MQIDADLDGGNILVVNARRRGVAELALRDDSAAPMRQWFHFLVRAPRHERLELRIVNAGSSTFPDGWPDYRALASYDLDNWFRVPTELERGSLVIHCRPEREELYLGYFGAYPSARHEALLERADRSDRAEVVSMGESVEGRSLDLVVVGNDGPGKRRVWIIARQHPGETMSEWFVEGALSRLLDEDDPVARALLGEAVFYIVPNMNPDGSALGNFRTNAAGRDINREWLSPRPGTSPEVLAVRRMLEETDVDFFLDVHGDETAPCSFAIGCEGNPSYSHRLARLEKLFTESMADSDEGFSAEYGYGPDDPGKGDLSIANNWVGERFECLSLTLELPFKDGGDPQGGTPDRAVELGSSAMECVLESLGDLR
ncbi:M14 family metallopeptidase [Polyangium aurulentum]|uniref:M14 family metallopeptidase n=1 Tax=Polyangium aurulentum TaxID=2567896 RepID=UPI0010AE654C|nr:M14-type cytosolic carboxypeptidase [Polyangium aurulentum]UQA62085.1 carboxypeptidase family protein [Polyangium aurulentum]